MSNTISKKIENGVLSIIFNRPEKFNAFNSEMAKAVQDALSEAEQNVEVRAIYMSATGKAFCSGQDLKEAGHPSELDLREVIRNNYNPIILKMRQIMKPIVVAVNGVAAGAGANIALAGDIIVATESASFIQAFSKIGLIPDCGGTYFLPRAIGWARASALMMLGDKISASEAVHMGMIYKSFPDETFETDSYALAQYLATQPTQAFAYTKKALNESATHTLEQQLAVELDYQGRCGETADFVEGINAFVEKRPAQFIGK